MAGAAEAIVRFLTEKGMSIDDAIIEARRRVGQPATPIPAQPPTADASPSMWAGVPGGAGMFGMPSPSGVPVASTGDLVQGVADAVTSPPPSMGPDPTSPQSAPAPFGPPIESEMPEPLPSGEFDPFTSSLPRGINKDKLRQFAPMIDDAADRYGVPRKLMYGILSKENAQLQTDFTSDADAVGLFQVVPGANNTTREDMLNPSSNIDFAARKLKGLVDRYGGDYEKVGAAYFGGEGTVSRPKDQWGPKTREYGAEVASFMSGGDEMPGMSYDENQRYQQALREDPSLRGRPRAARDAAGVPTEAPTEATAPEVQAPAPVDWASRFAALSSDYDKQSEDQYRDYMSQLGKNQQEINQAIAKRQSLIKEYTGAKVDPARYWKNGSTAQNILRMLGATMGALAQGMSMGRVPNEALATIQREIQRDVDLQLEEIKRLGAAADSQNNLLADLYRKSGDLRQSYRDAQSIMLQSFNTKVDALKTALGFAQGPEQKELKSKEGVDLLKGLRSVERIHKGLKDIQSVGEWTRLDGALNKATLGMYKGEDASKIAQLGLEAITKMTELGQGRLSNQDMDMAKAAIEGEEWDKIRPAVKTLRASLQRIAAEEMAKARHLKEAGYQLTPEIAKAYERAGQLSRASQAPKGKKVSSGR
jgi:hypothetical protein